MNACKTTNVQLTAAASTASISQFGRVGRAVFSLALLATPALAVPQIEVRVNNLIIANNQEVNLPDTVLGQSSPLIVVVRNIGNQDLLFTGDPFVSLFGGFPENFSLIQPPLEAGDKLSPGGSTAFRVDFTPTFVAERLDTKAFIFTNSVPTAFGITLVGRCVGPRMSVKQDGVTIADAGTVIFPDTPVGQTSTVELVIENAGSAALQLTGTLPASLGGGQVGLFAVSQQPTATIAPGSSSTMKITFTPTAATAVTTGLFIAHNEQSIFHDGLYGASVQARGFPAVDIVEEEEVLEEEIVDVNENANDNVNEVEEEIVQENDDNAGEQLNDNVADEQYGNQNDNQYEDDGDDGKNDDQELDNDRGVSPMGNPCGFGVGFAVPACMLGLCSVRASVRRRVPGR